MAGAAHYALKVLDVFSNFNGRRSGIIRALTTDFQEFYRQCDPEKDAQCLVGLPNGTWEVKPLDRLVPPDGPGLPRPVSGINFERNRMPEQEWVATVAAGCDSWLLAVAFYFGGHASFPKNEREMLFQMINELPTVCKTAEEFGKPNDQSSTTMLKKPGSCSTVKMSSPQKDDSGAATKVGHNDGSSSWGQSKFSGTYVNSSADDSRAQKNESGTPIEDGHNDGSSSHGQNKSPGTHVNSSDDDSGDSVCLRKR